MPEGPVAMVAGSNVALPAHTAGHYIDLVVSHASSPGVDLDLAVVAVGPDGRVSVDDDLVFFNNPRHPSGSIEHLGQREQHGRSWDAARIHCALVPDEVTALHATLTGAHRGFPAIPDLRVEIVDHQRTAIALIDTSNLRSESAAVLLEVYRRSGAWKVRAVAQGWDAGFSALVEHYGVGVEGTAPPAPPTSSSGTALPPAAPVHAAPALPPAGGVPAYGPAAPAGWHLDPFRRFEQRYWDGVRWTPDVVTHGQRSMDPPLIVSPIPSAPAPPLPPSTPQAPPAAPPATRASRQVQRQLRTVGVGAIQSASTTLLDQSVLVVNQKAKLFGVNTEYAVFDEQGQKLGAVREVGNLLLRKAMGGGGQHGTHKFQVIDPAGAVLISMHRPPNIMRSKMIVVGAGGVGGEIAQKTVGVFGNVRFDLVSAGQVLGSIKAESRAAWDFSVQDATGAEIARISKTWAGWARETFTKADNYVVQIHRPLPEPLRTLVVAAALAVDTALKQDGGSPNRRAR